MRDFRTIIARASRSELQKLESKGLDVDPVRTRRPIPRLLVKDGPELRWNVPGERIYSSNLPNSSGTMRTLKLRRPLVLEYRQRPARNPSWLTDLRKINRNIERAIRILATKYKFDSVITVNARGGFMDGLVFPEESLDVNDLNPKERAAKLLSKYYGDADEIVLEIDDERAFTHVCRSAFGRELTAWEIAGLAGGLGLQGEVKITVAEIESDGFHLYVKNRDVKSMAREVHLDDDDGPYISNEIFNLKKDARGGIGAACLYGQALTAKSLGMSHLECYAARSSTRENVNARSNRESVITREEQKIEDLKKILRLREKLDFYPISLEDHLEDMQFLPEPLTSEAAQGIAGLVEMLSPLDIYDPVAEDYTQEPTEFNKAYERIYEYMEYMDEPLEQIIADKPFEFTYTLLTTFFKSLASAEYRVSDIPNGPEILANLHKTMQGMVKILEYLEKSFDNKVAERANPFSKFKIVTGYLAGLKNQDHPDDVRVTVGRMLRHINNMMHISSKSGRKNWRENVYPKIQGIDKILSAMMSGDQESLIPMAKEVYESSSQKYMKEDLSLKKYADLTDEQIKTKIRHSEYEIDRVTRGGDASPYVLVGEDPSRVSGEYVGYLVWAKYGYNEELRNVGLSHDDYQSLIANGLFGSEDEAREASIHDLMSTPKGQNWWTRFGAAWDAKFDLTDRGDGTSSDCIQFLERYLANKAKHSGSVKEWLNRRASEGVGVEIDEFEQFILDITWQEFSEMRSARKVAQRMGL